MNFTAAADLADKGAAFQHLDEYEKTKGWLDQSLTWIVPTRGMVDIRVVEAWDNLDWPMNQARTAKIVARGFEVGAAYNYLFRLALDREFAGEKYHPGYADIMTGTRFVLSMEDDNIPKSDAVLKLLAAIYTCPDCGKDIADVEQWTCPEGHRGFDAVSGLYFTKSIPPRPMAYGNPKNGPDDFAPQSVKQAVADGTVLEVNGIAMGCAIWRKELFRKVSQPWFETVQTDSAAGTGGNTQDLYFCKKAKDEADARFGVHCGVKVAHLNTKTGEIFC
jgi:hypothetical protein